MQQTPEGASLRRELIEACREDVLFFINMFCWLNEPRARGKQPKAVPFCTFPMQERAIETLVKSIGAEDVLIEKSRDVGATWFVLAVFLWFWLFHPGCNFLMVSRNEKLVDDSSNPKSLFWKLDHLMGHMPHWMLPNFERQKLKLANLDNGSEIDGESTTGDLARGDRRLAIFMDELPAFEIQDGLAAMDATQYATDSRVMSGTPDGAVGAFYARRQAIMREGGGKVIRLHWSERPDYARGLYASLNGSLILIDRPYWEELLGAAFIHGREILYECPFGKFKGWQFDPRELPREVYNFILEDNKLRSPWYDYQVRRANGNRKKVAKELDIDYQGAGGPFFDQEIIVEHIHKFGRAPLAVGDLVVRDFIGAEYDWQPGFNPSRLSLWCMVDPITRRPPPGRYAIFCDISMGSGASNTVFSVGDKKTGTKVAEWADSHTGSHDAAITAVALARWFHDALLGWERLGPGDEFGRKVMDLGYRKLYFGQEHNTTNRRSTKIPGWSPGKDAKRVLLRDYQSALDEGRMTNPSVVALNECMKFFLTAGDKVVHVDETDEDDPTGAKSNHGDRVIADAGLLLCLGALPAVKPEEAPKHIPLVCSFAGRRELERRDRQKRERESRY